MQKQIFLFLFTIIAFFLGITACKFDPINPDPTDSGASGGTQKCSQDTIYFQNQILPLLISNCTQSGCHNAADHKEGIDLSSYQKLMSSVEKVKSTDWKKNELVKVLLDSDPDDRMPLDLPPFSTAQIDLIKKWVQQGAVNNACNESFGSCDSLSTVSYSQFVRPLLEAKCIGCHNNTNPQGGINLSNYDKLKPFATNGKLYQSVSLNANWMPKGGVKLDNCALAKLKSWINNGALNN